jgi:hypothetical protein
MLPAPILFGRDVRHRTLGLDLLPDGIGVIGSIRHGQRIGWQALQQGLGGAAVRCLARHQQEC